MGHYVVFVHGIGEQSRGSYDGFGAKLEAAFHDEARRAGKPSQAFLWEEAYWAGVTQPDQQDLKRRVGLGGNLRSFMIGSLGDVVAYSELPYPPDKYGEIQQRFTDTIDKVSQKALQAGDNQALLTIVAHSLGTVIASDRLYELTKQSKMPSNLTLHGFYSMGSPIALFGLRYGLPNFTRPIRPKQWINFYYPQDVIGYPLKPLNPEYNAAVTTDVCLQPQSGVNIVTGAWRWLIAKLPLVGISSHSWYFTNNRVIRDIAHSLIT